MSDTTSAPIGGIDQAQLQNLINQLTGPQQAAPPTLPDSGPSSREGRGFLSLLGEALGGGQQYGSTADREQGGLSAAQAMGLRMLAASDYSVRPHTLGSIIAQGQLGARESLGQSQAVASARQQAAYDQARQAQQDQLARLKEAIPLLELKGKLAAVSATPATLDGDSGGGGILEPYIAPNLPAGVSAAEDQMVRTIIGEAGNQGTTGQQAVAHVIKNRMAAGGQSAQDVIFSRNQFEPWNNPKTRAGLEGIDPNSAAYQAILKNVVRPVMAGTAKDPTGGATHFYSPTTQKALGRDAPSWAQGQTPTIIGAHNFYKLPYGGGGGSPAPAPPPGRTAAAPPPGGPMATPTPTRQPDPGPGNIPLPPGAAPPPSDTAGPATTEPPIAPGAGAQVAGPGAPTAPGVAPTMPGTDATVAAIREGMVRSGANPDTLEPGPVPGMGGTPAAGPAAPPEPAPGSFEAYKKLHAAELVPDPTTSSLFNPQPDADQLRVIQSQKRQAQLEYQQARQAADLAGQSKAREKYIDAQTQENTMRENARKLGVETQRSWLEKQNDRLFQAWTAETKLTNDRADKEQQQRDELARIVETGRQTRESQEAAEETKYVNDERKTFGTEREGARQSIDQVQLLRTLSAAAGTATPLEQLQLPNGQSVRDTLAQLQWGTPDALKRWDAQQAFENTANQMIINLRKGVQMGQLSDRDMAFIQSMVPSLGKNPATRDSILATIENAQARKREYIDMVENLWDGGKSKGGMSWGQAKREADKRMAPIVPQVPQEYSTMPLPDKIRWFQSNAKAGSIFRGPDKLDDKGNVVQRGDIMVAPELNIPGGTR